MKKSDRSINRQKTIDFIISRNYGKEAVAQKIRDDIQRHLGINYTVWNVTSIRQDIKNGIAKSSTITETLLPPEVKMKNNGTPAVVIPPVVTPPMGIAPEEPVKTKTEELQTTLTKIKLVTDVAKQVGGIDELITIATLVKQHKLMD